MSFSHQFTISHIRNAVVQTHITTPVSSAGQEVGISEAVPAESADFAVACVLDQSQVKSLIITIDKAATVVAKDDGDQTVNTWVFVANGILVWSDQMPHTNPLSGDITSLEVTTGDDGEALLRVFALVDPTS